MRARGEISDAELQERCRPHAWERSLRTLEIAAILLGGLLAGVAAGIYVKDVDFMNKGVNFCVAAFFAFFVASVIGSILCAIRERLPIAADREELAFRRWRAGLHPSCPPKKLRDWSRQTITQEPGPDWLVILQGAALPHGGRVSVRVFITIDQPGMSKVMACQAKGTAKAVPLTSTENSLVRRVLSQHETDELTHLLVNSFPDGFKSFPRSEVRDGFPCDLLIFRRNPPSDTRVSFNLGARGADVQQPSIALARQMLHLGRDGQDRL